MEAFNLPHLYLAPPLGVTLLEFHRDLWNQKPRVQSYRMVLFVWSGLWQTDTRQTAYTTLA